MGTASRFRAVVGLTSALLCILVSRLLTLLLKRLLGVNHTLDFFRLLFRVCVEIGSIILETNWNELVLSILVQQFLKMNSHSLTYFAVSRNHLSTIMSEVEILSERCCFQSSVGLDSRVRWHDDISLFLFRTNILHKRAGIIWRRGAQRVDFAAGDPCSPHVQSRAPTRFVR